MPKLTLNGIEVEVERGSTVLEAAQFLGIPIPTLCHDDGLTPYGACRLCVVEVGTPPRSKLQSACTLVAEEGLVVQTHSARVERARQLLLELYVATSPQSKTIQDLASRYGVREVRLEPEHEDCIQCGKCVRMCAEQMMAGAIGFAFRGQQRKVTSPFRPQSELSGTAARACTSVRFVSSGATARRRKRRCAVAASTLPPPASTTTITPCASLIPAWPAN